MGMEGGREGEGEGMSTSPDKHEYSGLVAPGACARGIPLLPDESTIHTYQHHIDSIHTQDPTPNSQQQSPLTDTQHTRRAKEKLTFKNLVKSIILHPSIPISHCNRLYLPSTFSRGSFAHGPTGHLKRCSWTSTNPALIIFSFASSTMRNVFPNASPAWSETLPHSSKTVLFVLPSSDLGTTETSTCSR